eukprot:TRINITY_DN404_c0_g1_i24.p1 TRINITY_DN404_c0_g1~~TRINITY_DN404_c0_g1_i24.p1  ORF type:complete len:715 (-),score=90.89 TRINITY_DN404_c0_g1_i24:263-2407(-)
MEDEAPDDGVVDAMGDLRADLIKALERCGVRMHANLYAGFLIKYGCEAVDDLSRLSEDALVSYGLAQIPARKIVDRYNPDPGAFGARDNSTQDLSKRMAQLTVDNAANSDPPSDDAANVMIIQAPRNSRDQACLPPGGKLLRTLGVRHLLDQFWSAVDSTVGSLEMCVNGAFGSGKSCALKILTADVQQKKSPDDEVWYFRDSLSESGSIRWQLMAMPQNSCVYLFFDQVMNDGLAQELASLADLSMSCRLILVMVSSANVPHFHKEEPASSQHRKIIVAFPFSCSPSECQALVQLLKEEPDKEDPDKEEAKESTFDYIPSGTLEVESLQMAHPALDDYDAIFTWTNGHMLSISKLVLKRETPDEMLQRSAKLITEFLAQETNFEFCLAVIEMFQQKQTHLGTYKGKFDWRFMGMTRGAICCLSPLFLQAYQYALLVGGIEASTTNMMDHYFNPMHKHLLSNPVMVGFGIEKLCLENVSLLRVAFHCLALMNVTLDEATIPIMRIGYQEHDQIQREIYRQRQHHPNEDWGLHCIPLRWNEKDVDAIQVYSLNRRVFIIGNSVTISPARDHLGSCEWSRKIPDFMPDASFILVFTCSQTDDRNVVQIDDVQVRLRCRAYLTSIMDYPFTDLVRLDAILMSGVDPGRRSYGARRLQIDSRTVKCGCQMSHCGNNQCSCRKAGLLCVPDRCGCVECQNMMEPCMWRWRRLHMQLVSL